MAMDVSILPWVLIGKPFNTANGRHDSWIEQPEKVGAKWTVHPIGEERLCIVCVGVISMVI